MIHQCRVADYGGLYDQAYYSRYGHTPYAHRPEWQGFFAGVAITLKNRLKPNSVFDAGCAIGLLVDAFRKIGVEAWGSDISEFAITQVPSDIRAFCWQGDLTDRLSRQYDLITFIEVAEHIPPEIIDTVLKRLCEATNTIFFSSTPDRFPDPTHFNVQEAPYWIEKFMRQGFVHNDTFDSSFLAPHALLFRRTTPFYNAALIAGRILNYFRQRLLAVIKFR